MTTLLIRLVLPLLFVATASADWVIESTVESAKVNGVLTVKVKGDKVRMDIPNGRVGSVSSILDTKTGDTLQIVHASKMVMKMDGAAMKQMITNAREKSGMKEGDAAELKPTGEKEKVGEYDCDIYNWTNGAITKKYWVAKDHPQAAALMAWEKQMRSGFMGGLQAGPDTTKLPGPAIKTESTTAAGTVRSIITSIKEQEVDPKDFEVPEGYQTMGAPGAPPAK
ncbi:MAG TPA: DUF4412 domain-containing protein [Chthoniobacter sp.]|nr:DUF4412 domain-containing protein [Chthoniobacter sp.]